MTVGHQHTQKFLLLSEPKPRGRLQPTWPGRWIPCWPVYSVKQKTYNNEGTALLIGTKIVFHVVTQNIRVVVEWREELAMRKKAGRGERAAGHWQETRIRLGKAGVKKSKFLICKLPKTRGQMNKSFETLEFDSSREDLPELAKNGEEEQFFFLQLWIRDDVDQVD